VTLRIAFVCSQCISTISHPFIRWTLYT
jgi:hypothetical protein